MAEMSTDENIIVADREKFRADLLEVLTRAGLLLALAVLCFQVFSPFLTLMAWALILAVTLYPLQQWIAGRLGDRQGLAATHLAARRAQRGADQLAGRLGANGDRDGAEQRGGDSRAARRYRRMAAGRRAYP
jgi:hypothetical protein